MSSRFPSVTPEMERFSLDLPRTELLKNGECVLGVGYGGVVRPRVREICNSMLIYGKIL